MGPSKTIVCCSDKTQMSVDACFLAKIERAEEQLTMLSLPFQKSLAEYGHKNE
jgi:hypothetical protein